MNPIYLHDNFVEDSVTCFSGIIAIIIVLFLLARLVFWYQDRIAREHDKESEEAWNRMTEILYQRNNIMNKWIDMEISTEEKDTLVAPLNKEYQSKRAEWMRAGKEKTI